MVNNFNYKINKKSKDNFTKSQRQLRVGEELRHLISNVLLRETFYDQIIENNNITITEVNVSPDLKNAKVYIMPLGGENKFEVLDSLNKANGRIRKLISNALLRETFYDQIIVNNHITITEVNVSPDLKNAKVYIMPLGGENKFEVLDSLNKANGRIKKLISNNINLRQIPKLQFRIDETFEYAKNIENILQTIKK